MADLNKVRVQLLDSSTGAVLQEVDVLTSANSVLFGDGQTFQQKLDAGVLRGALGPKGDTGAVGSQGIQGKNGDPGAKGDPGIQGIKGDTGATGSQGTSGEVVKVGTSYANGSQVKLFLKIV
ncbi:collagen-like protein [Clostridium sp. FP1]|uniref:collagen-like triple helix repeat-containing protein n=1 Tax=Clostridium sp. FP1 TaxID=2724076 RepID=UPI0013E9561E|nr:collagen-like protein [Clostridium sp. FP1]MBZ9637520.1 collagen-like protein [Clostridium sp. FP1]